MLLVQIPMIVDSEPLGSVICIIEHVLWEGPHEGQPDCCVHQKSTSAVFAVSRSVEAFESPT
jgi:hypothetical protein